MSDMAGALEEKFILALKEVGFKTRNVKWMVDNESTKHLIQWFCENIDSSDYLTEEELNEYNQIVASGNALEGADLDRELQKIIPDFEDLDGKETEILQHSKKELADLENVQMNMKKLDGDLRNEMARVDSQINELEIRNRLFENKIAKMQELYHKNLTDLAGGMKRLEENVKNVVDHCNDCNQGVQSSKLIADFPLEVYMDESALIESCIQKSIDELKHLEYQQQSSNCLIIGDLDSEIADLPRRFEATRLLKLKQGSERKAMESSIACVEQILSSSSFWASLSSPSSVWKMTHDTKQRILVLKQELGDLEKIGEHSNLDTSASPSTWWKKARKETQTFALNQRYGIECLYREMALIGKNQSLKALKSIKEEVKNLCSKDLVWMMILGDEVFRVMNASKIISSMIDVVENTKNDGLHRMEFMKSSKERRDYEMQKIESYPLLHCLLSYQPQHSKPGNRASIMHSSSFSENSSLSENISFTLKSLVSSSENLKAEVTRTQMVLLQQINQHNCYIKSSCKDVLKLKRRIYNGFTSKKPVLCSPKGLSIIYNQDMKDEDLELKLKRLKKISSTKKDESFLLLRKLWAIFYTNPSMLKELLQKEDDDNNNGKKELLRL